MTLVFFVWRCYLNELMFVVIPEFSGNIFFSVIDFYFVNNWKKDPHDHWRWNDIQ